MPFNGKSISKIIKLLKRKDSRKHFQINVLSHLTNIYEVPNTSRFYSRQWRYVSEWKQTNIYLYRICNLLAMDNKEKSKDEAAILNRMARQIVPVLASDKSYRPVCMPTHNRLCYFWLVRQEPWPWEALKPPLLPFEAFMLLCEETLTKLQKN